MLIIVNFHYVRPSYDDLPFPAIHGITPDGFRRQLLMLGEFGRFVGLAQVCDAVAGGKGLPDVSLLVTFDDGLREQHEYAWPILQELDIPAVFFPNTRPIATSTVSVVHQIHLLRAHTPPGEFSTDVRRV
ncbi:MAG: polysaccharide deacetylase family protein, partial [Planctomycetota bacterium]